MPRFSMKRVHGMAAVFAAAILCTSCSGSQTGSHQGPDAITAVQAAAEYKNEGKKLTLAPGWDWPANPTPPSTAPDGNKQVYQRGWGTTSADSYWYCSWQRQYLKPGLSEANKDAAYLMLKRVHQTHLYQVDTPKSEQTAFDKELQDAGLGDTAAMEQDVRVNCPKASS